MFVFSVYILTSRAVTDAFPKQNRDVDILCTLCFLVRTELEKKKIMKVMYLITVYGLVMDVS